MEKSRRYLLKLSGEVLGDKNSVFSPSKIDFLIHELTASLKEGGVLLSIVIGGGNIARGRELGSLEIPHIRADHMGMLATCINGILLSERLKLSGIKSKVISALECGNFTEVYNAMQAKEYMNNGYTLVFVMGTGNPLFSTDTVSVLRAIELGINTVLKATKVNGVYNKDPEKYNDVVMYNSLTFDEAVDRNLKVMDMEAFMLAKEYGIKIRVFNILERGNLQKILHGEDIGTLVQNAV